MHPVPARNAAARIIARLPIRVERAIIAPLGGVLPYSSRVLSFRSQAVTTRSNPRRTAPSAWWRTYFDAGYLREYQPLFDLTEDRAQVARLVELLALPSGSRVLDLACGQGRHAHLLAEAGFDVDGLDLSTHLLAVARERGTG